MDERRADLGRAVTVDWRDNNQPPAASVNRERLLADLIGGDAGEAGKLAAKLIATFGSAGSVLAAPPTALARFIDDPGLVSRIAAAKALVMASIGEQLRRERFDIADRQVQHWLIGLFKWRRSERLHFALLSHDLQLLWEEKISDGDVHNVCFNLRKIVSRAIDVGASAVVLMHNHPSGDPQPSAADISETRRIASLLKQLDLRLHDHLIVAANTIFSMQGAKLI